MKYVVKESVFSKLSARLNLMFVLVFGLMLSNIILSYLALHSLNHQKREIVPYACNSSYIKSDSYVDKHYLFMMTKNFVYSRLNVTPSNVGFNYSELLKYVDSSIYPQFKKKLAKEEKIIKSKKIGSYFEITDIQPGNNELVTIVKGNLKRYVGYRALEEEKKIYQIQYLYQQGQLTIASFTEVKGEQNA